MATDLVGEMKGWVDRYLRCTQDHTKRNLLKSLLHEGGREDVTGFLEGLRQAETTTHSAGAGESNGATASAEAESHVNVAFAVSMLLYWATDMGDLDTVKLLVETQGADVNNESSGADWKVKWLPIEAAVVKGHVDCLKYLIEKGADVNPTQHKWMKYVLLMTAVKSRHVKCINLLLHHGADVKLAPLVTVVRLGHLECVKPLVEFGADVNQTVAGDTTPLIAAVESGQLECAQLLVEHGADVNFTRAFSLKG